MKKPVLYHGTDARMIEMSEEERQHFFDTCDHVINALFPYFELAKTEHCRSFFPQNDSPGISLSDSLLSF